MAYGWLFLRTLIVLGGVLALAYVALRLLARHVKRRSPSSEGHIEVLERHFIEPRRSLLVVRTGEQHWLLASTEHGLQPLGELNPEPWQSTEAPSLEAPDPDACDLALPLHETPTDERISVSPAELSTREHAENVETHR
ncbi:FliO/MopB family protein [Lujinxingia litoralis]|uniref:FliO/MopB family protein n=1 Tax=Lujinxingia litoralis TaxID=2211119 RepID=UPI001315030B|nr:flagellar biosynthetic protein FliO [Lujinxingia litoralis]